MNSVFTIPELVYTILALPVAFSILAAVNVCGNTVLHWLNRLTATAAAAAAVQLLLAFDPALPAAFGYFYLDALGLWMLLIVTALYLAFAWTSKAYLDRDTNIRYGYLRRFSQLEGRFLCAVASLRLDDDAGGAGR
jgi:hydrogenase-4 component F